MAEIKKGHSVSIEITNPLVSEIGITVTAGEIELELTGSGEPPQSLFPKKDNEAHKIPRPSKASAIKLTGRGDINIYIAPPDYYTISSKTHTTIPTGPNGLPKRSV